MVDRLDTVRDALDGEHREAVDFVVIAGVVAVRPFVGHLARVNHTLKHDLGAGRNLQIAATALDQLGARATQQTGKGIFGEAVRYRRHGTENGRRVRAQCDGHRIRLARVLDAPVAEVQRTTAMAEPAHDDLVATDDLLAIDAEVLALLVGAFGDRQAPGDQRRDIARPAGLYRQHAEVDVIAFDDDLLAGRILDDLRRHGDDLAEDRQFGPGVLQALGWLGLFEKRQQLADFTQFADRFGAHAHGDALRCAEQVAEHRDIKTDRFFE